MADEPRDDLMPYGVDTVRLRISFPAASVSQGYNGRMWRMRLFPTPASAAPYLNNPEGLANHVYANRNGNGDEASGDGWRYLGRGLMQVTGRSEYRAVGHENDPEALETSRGAADAAAAYWANHGLNGRTTGTLDRQQFDRVSRTVNAHDPNLQARWDAYQSALRALNAGP